MMEVNVLKGKLCTGVEPEEEEDGFRKVEKVLAPFMRTLKKRKRVKADVLPEENQEPYLKRNPKDLIARLQNSLASAGGFRTLLNETAELLKVATNSKSVNIYLVDYVRGNILLCPRFVQNNERFEKRYTIGTYVAAYVAFAKEYVISNDILGDVRFPQGIPEVATAKSVICVPMITNAENECLGVIELYRDCSAGAYDLVNLQTCTALTAWMGIAVEQNRTRLALLKEMEIQKQLSALSDLYFSGTMPFNKVVSDILEITKSAVNAEKGAFYVFREPVPLHSEEALYADAYEEGMNENNETILYKKRNRTRFVMGEPGLPGYSARSGEIINVHDAYKDVRFNRKTDSPFFRTRSVVSIPIKNEHGVLAAIKLINNLNFPYFRKEEIDLIASYLSNIGLMCGYFLLDTAYNKTQLKLLETYKLLDFYTKPLAEDIASVKAFVQAEFQLPNGFFRFDWDASNFEDEAHKYIAYALLTCGGMEPCFEYQNVADFLLRVRKAYRPVLYHNFEHGFIVFHCAFNMLNRVKDKFSVVEVVTILLAALCHDVDHDGLTNSFISLKNDTLYKLYGELCGEAHRYEVCLFLIQSTDLLSKVTAQNYQLICKNLKKLMLAFDLAIHFQNRIKITELLNSETMEWDNPEHRLLSQNMILMCSDFSMNFKPFDTVKKYTSNYCKELYKQGDLEKSMGFTPLPLMDRNKLDVIPDNQIILLTIICLPCIEVVVRCFPNLGELQDLLKVTISKWNEVIVLRGQEMWKMSQALPKDKRERRSHRVTLSSTLSSIKTIISDTRSEK